MRYSIKTGVKGQGVVFGILVVLVAGIAVALVAGQTHLEYLSYLLGD